MKRLSFYIALYIAIFNIIICISCEDKFKSFPLINYTPCEENDVVFNPNIITDFECQSNFILNNVEPVRNPSESPFNTSKFVGKYIDTPGPHDFISINFDSAIDLSENTVFKIKIKTEISGELRVMLDGGDSPPVFISKTIDGDNGWGIYNFDFSWNLNESHKELKIFFNYGQELMGGIPNVYYIDDLIFDQYLNPCQDIQKIPNILGDFECQQNYEIINSSNNIKIITNPYPDNINNSLFVGEFIDNGTDESDALSIDFGETINLSENPRLHFKIYSSITAPILVELHGDSSTFDVANNIVKTGEWVNYIFDFSSADYDYTSLKIYFNYGVTDGDSEQIFFVDEIMFLPAPCDEPLTEDCSGVITDLNIISDWNCQQNYGIENSIPVVNNPLISCENRSQSVGKYTDNGSEPWDAFILNYGNPINLNTYNKLKFKLFTPSSIQVLAKIEGGSAVEKWSDFSMINSWQEFSYDFSDSISKENTTLVLFFNAGQSNGSNQDVYFIDNLRWEEN